MNIDKIEMVQELLAFAILKEKSNLIDLLRANGVDMEYDASDDDVLVATLNASAKSKYFKDELTKLLSNMALENIDTFKSFSGEDDQDFFNFIPTNTKFQQGLVAAANYGKTGSTTGTKPATTGTTGTKTQSKFGAALSKVGSWLGANVFTPQNIQAGIGLGITAMNNKSQKKADEAAANLEAIRQQKLALEQMTGGGGGNQGDGGGGKNKKTIMWVLIGVGVLALATGIFFAVRKKGTTAPSPATV